MVEQMAVILLTNASLVICVMVKASIGFTYLPIKMQIIKQKITIEMKVNDLRYCVCLRSTSNGTAISKGKKYKNSSDCRPTRQAEKIRKAQTIEMIEIDRKSTRL